MITTGRAIVLGINQFSGTSKKTGSAFSINNVIFLDDSNPKENIEMSVDLKDGGQQILNKAQESRLQVCEFEMDVTTSNGNKYLNLRKLLPVK